MRAVNLAERAVQNLLIIFYSFLICLYEGRFVLCAFAILSKCNRMNNFMLLDSHSHMRKYISRNLFEN